MASTLSARTAFAPRHRFDRAMVTAAVIAVWTAILLGFGLDLVHRAHNGQLSFPLVTHLHVIAYGGWLVLVAAQVWLVRTGRTALHRRVGVLAWAFLPAMLVLGPAAALVSASNPYMPDRWIAWLIVQFTNATASVALLAAGLVAHRHPAAHRRLMVLGTVALTEPGFGRLWESPVFDRWGDGYLPFVLATYGGTALLVGAIGVFDLATRGRLHPAYVGGTLWIAANEALATVLFHRPGWLAVARAMTGHPPG